MIINFKSINDEKIWETWDLKKYVNNLIFFLKKFSLNPAEPMRTRQFWENRKNSKNPSRYSEKIWKIRAVEKSQIFSFFALRYVRVLFQNQRKSEKWRGKRWEFKKRIGEKFRKNVENECFGKISHFLINVPKHTENMRKCLKKFWEILNKFLRMSEKISKKIWEIFLPGFTQRVHFYCASALAYRYVFLNDKDSNSLAFKGQVDRSKVCDVQVDFSTVLYASAYILFEILGLKLSLRALIPL